MLVFKHALKLGDAYLQKVYICLLKTARNTILGAGVSVLTEPALYPSANWKQDPSIITFRHSKTNMAWRFQEL